MNEYDSDRMGDCLVPFGYGRVGAPDQADVIILNTCHIRERAAHKVFSELGRLRVLKQARERDGARTLLVVAGCVAQAEGREIIARAPFVDVVVGPQTYHRLPALLARAWDRNGPWPGPLIDTELPQGEKFDALPAPPPARDRGAVTAFLTVQEGCDKFCSFCVVPYTRGAEVSRPAAQVIAEARRMAASGVREITLLGQNVNAWHGQGSDGGTWSLARLIGALCEIPGLLRLRYTTSHPLDMDDDLIAAHARAPKLMPFLHLPVQSGSDRILAAMNRRYAVDTYVRLVERLRRARPDIALSSDFIVGYPGETDADFAATLRLVERVTFAQAFTFKYSDRPGTPSAQAAASVPDAVKDTRLQALQALIRAQQTAFNQDCLGATMPVLFTGPGRQTGQLVGRSPYLQPVHGIAPSHLIGCEIPMRITEAHTGSLAATPVMEIART